MLEVFVSSGEGLQRFGELVPNQVCSGFQERQHYLIEKTSPGVALYIDDEPLRTDSSELYWEWSPGFYAGQVVAELEIEGEQRGNQFLIDVSPDPSKAGREIFGRYISDIADYAPALLLGTEPAAQNLSGKSPLTNVWVAYARLRTWAARYLRAMKEVSANPISRLSHTRQHLPMHLVKSADVTTAQRLVANQPLLAAISAQADGALAEEEDVALKETTLDVPFNTETLDNPANREMLRQLLDVVRRVDWLSSTLTAYKEASSETQTNVAARIPRRLRLLREIRRELMKLLRRHPFTKVSLRESSAAGLNGIAGNPLYAHAHQLGRNLLSPGLSELSEKERLYIGPTWQIYEAWCFCALAEELENRFPNYEWKRIASMSHVDMLLEGTRGHRRIRLYFQLVCPSLLPSKSHGYHTISRERRPDLVLELKNEHGQNFICLDAKYMARRGNILEAMSSAHVYRDSVKWNGQPPLLSLLLVPAGDAVPELSAERYLRQYQEGCLELSSDITHVIDLLMEKLPDMVPTGGTAELVQQDAP